MNIQTEPQISILLTTFNCQKDIMRTFKSHLWQYFITLFVSELERSSQEKLI